jgi:hypothetical protein
LYFFSNRHTRRHIYSIINRENKYHDARLFIIRVRENLRNMHQLTTPIDLQWSSIDSALLLLLFVILPPSAVFSCVRLVKVSKVSLKETQRECFPQTHVRVHAKMLLVILKIPHTHKHVFIRVTFRRHLHGAGFRWRESDQSIGCFGEAA